MDTPPDGGLTRELIDEACAFLRGRVRHTPIEPSPGLAEALGVPVWLKLEHLQITGSFKVRGALFRMSRLTPAERARGVTTCSAGNHGKGVAWAARVLDIDAEVHVPASVDPAKLRGILALGARVVQSDLPGYDDTEEVAMAAAAAAGRVWISPFDDPAVMAANGGSLAAEILADLPDARTLVLPVGGGGMSAGAAFLAPEAVIVGTQHAGSPGLARSIASGEAVTRLPAIDTLAGGVEGGLGRLPFEVLRRRVRPEHVALVEEPEIRAATRWTLAQHQYLIEPTAAVPVAACLSGRLPPLEGPVVVVLSGRNVALETVRALLVD